MPFLLSSQYLLSVSDPVSQHGDVRTNKWIILTLECVVGGSLSIGEGPETKLPWNCSNEVPRRVVFMLMDAF